MELRIPKWKRRMIKAMRWTGAIVFFLGWVLAYFLHQWNFAWLIIPGLLIVHAAAVWSRSICRCPCCEEKILTYGSTPSQMDPYCPKCGKKIEIIWTD